ncbi:hypothetical protein [Bacillus sp. EB600]|nr:hypothetical protein [Bacillus sp. EB600]
MGRVIVMILTGFLLLAEKASSKEVKEGVFAFLEKREADFLME